MLQKRVMLLGWPTLLAGQPLLVTLSKVVSMCRSLQHISKQQPQTPGTLVYACPLHYHVHLLKYRAGEWDTECYVQSQGDSCNSSSNCVNSPLEACLVLAIAKKVVTEMPQLTCYLNKPLMSAVVQHTLPDLTVGKQSCKVSSRLVSLHDFRWLAEWFMRPRR